MKKSFGAFVQGAIRTFFLFTLVLSPVALCAQNSALTLAQTIALPGVGGKFDHLVADTKGERLFLAAKSIHAVVVIDLKTGKIVQSLTGVSIPHGLAWVAETGSLYVADGGLGELRVYRGAPLALAGTIKLSADADDMVYDAAHHLLFVGHGTGEAGNATRVAVVDTENFSLLTNLPVAAHPEALDLDAKRGKAYVNVAGAAQIAVIDTLTQQQSALWKLSVAADNVPIAVNEETGVVYSACRKPAVVVAFDAVTGKEIDSQPASVDADDLYYDAERRHLYLIAGSGEVDVFPIAANGKLLPMQTIKTAFGAKTGLFVPQQNKLYIPVAGGSGRAAELRVYVVAGAEGKR
jgi:DNA-binding beta-propeller fold protein YncE